MSNIKILNAKFEESSTESSALSLDASLINVPVVHQVVKATLANRRQGTHSVKTRSTIRGGGSKPFKQKGTGRARQGSIRTPLRPGGGIVFGPKPRKYNLEMNRKERRLALRTALMSRISDAKIIKDFGSKLEVPKTSEILALIKRVGIDADGKIQHRFLLA